MKYLLTLKDRTTKEVQILKHPLYPCKISGEGNTKYRTLKEIEVLGRDVEWVDMTDPFRFWIDYIGAIRDENHFFEAQRGLRNPIVSLVLAE